MFNCFHHSIPSHSNVDFTMIRSIKCFPSREGGLASDESSQSCKVDFAQFAFTLGIDAEGPRCMIKFDMKFCLFIPTLQTENYYSEQKTNIPKFMC